VLCACAHDLAIERSSPLPGLAGPARQTASAAAGEASRSAASRTTGGVTDAPSVKGQPTATVSIELDIISRTARYLPARPDLRSPLA